MLINPAYYYLLLLYRPILNRFFPVELLYMLWVSFQQCPMDNTLSLYILFRERYLISINIYEWYITKFLKTSTCRT